MPISILSLFVQSKPYLLFTVCICVCADVTCVYFCCCVHLFWICWQRKLVKTDKRYFINKHTVCERPENLTCSHFMPFLLQYLCNILQADGPSVLKVCRQIHRAVIITWPEFSREIMALLSGENQQSRILMECHAATGFMDQYPPPQKKVNC